MTARPGVRDGTSSESVALARIVKALETRYAGQASPEQVAAAVEAAYGRFRTVPVREFVPVFVEQAARAELDRLVSHG